MLKIIQIDDDIMRVSLPLVRGHRGRPHGGPGEGPPEVPKLGSLVQAVIRGDVGLICTFAAFAALRHVSIL